MSRLVQISDRETVRIRVMLSAGRPVLDVRALERVSKASDHLHSTARGFVVPITHVADLVDALQRVAAEVDADPPPELEF